MLFGLDKNHIETMRSKEEGKVNVHLSPEIMNCIDDQNFFYYDKEKSDIFVVAMIIVDLCTLRSNFLFDPIKKKAMLEKIDVLLEEVRLKYSENLVSILS